MTELSSFTHLVEDVLDEIRNDRIKVTGDEIDVLLDSIDTIKAMLESRSNGSVFDEDISELEGNLKRFIESVTGNSSVPQKTTPKPVVSKPKKSTNSGGQTINDNIVLSEYDILELKEAVSDEETIYQVKVIFNEENLMNSVGGIQVFAALKEGGTVLRTIPEFEALYEDKFYPEVIYYVSSEIDPGILSNKVSIPDVVNDVEITPIAVDKIEKTKAVINPNCS